MPCCFMAQVKCWNFENSWSKECTAPGSKRRTCVQNVFFRPWTPPSPSVYIPRRHWHHSHNKMGQASPLRFCILQVITNWVVRRPGNNGNAYLHTLSNAHSITFQILMTQFILHQQTTKTVKHLLPKMYPLQVELMHTLQALLQSWYAKPTNIGQCPGKSLWVFGTPWQINPLHDFIREVLWCGTFRAPGFPQEKFAFWGFSDQF